MSIQLLQQRLNDYQCQTVLEEENAIKEISQEVILMALSRAGFFGEAQFHGGSALRILYGLPRFSEDLDFALTHKNTDFDWSHYMDKVGNELIAFGYNFEMVDRTQVDSNIKKMFLKDSSIGKLLKLEVPQSRTTPKKIRIKLEVDSNPPAGASSELKYLDFPLAFGVQSQTLSTSFSGKLHALLCREYLKGRDWYDFAWYIARNIAPNMTYLKNALVQYGPYEDINEDVDPKWLMNALTTKIKNVDWTIARSDVERFIKPNEVASVMLWDTAFFLDRVTKMGSYLKSK